MGKIDLSLLVERLHAAALGVESWEAALQAFAEATGSRSAQLCGLQGDELLFNVITNIDPAMTRILAETAADNPRVPVANSVPVLRTMADGDFLTQRSYFTRLARHVQSAVGIHTALERRGAVLMAGALEALQCAAFICDRRGYVRAMTPAGEQLVSGEGPLALRGHELCTRDEESTNRLHEAIRAAGLHRAPVERFHKRTVRIARGTGCVADVEIFALPEQPYELPFWPTILIVVRDLHERDRVAAAAAATATATAAAAPAAATAAAPSAMQRLDVAVHRRAQRAESALDAVAFAAFVLDGAGRVVHHNAAAESLLRQEDSLQLRAQRLHAADPLLDGRLHSLIASASSGAAPLPSPAGAIALSRRTGKQPLQIMVMSLRGPADTFAPGHVLVLVGDPARPANLPEAILGALYGLTRAEVEIANGLLAGHTVAEIARQRDVTTGTLRIQMKSIFQKTNTRRQSDLLKLLLSLAAMVGPQSHRR